MKIELEVDPGDLSKSLKEILDTLTPESRLDLARKAMESWLREPYDIERKAKEEEVLRYLRPQRDYSGRQESDDEIRRGYKFQEAMRGWKSTKEQMVETITREVSEQYKAIVRESVAQDPKIQAMKEEVAQIVKETFPRIFHDAMVAWTASNVQTMLEAANGMKALGVHQEKLEQVVGQRLMDLEGRMASRM